MVFSSGQLDKARQNPTDTITLMEPKFWHQRWQTGQIGFHSDQVHWALLKHWASVAQAAADTRVLVPLCGKSLDMRWLVEQGYPVTGVELDPIAVRDFFAEWQQAPDKVESGSHSLPGHGAGQVCLWQGDFMAFRPEQPFRLFYDRAALIALPEPMRREYMQHLRRCLQPGAAGLLVTLEYDQKQKDGPPFSVLYDEISGFECFTLACLERQDVLAESPKFRQDGVTSLSEAVYRLRAV